MLRSLATVAAAAEDYKAASSLPHEWSSSMCSVPVGTLSTSGNNRLNLESRSLGDQSTANVAVDPCIYVLYFHLSLMRVFTWEVLSP